MDTLTYNGLTQSFAAWGISYDRAICEKFNQREDIFSAFIPGSSVADPIFPFESQVIISSGGVQKFIGKAMPPIASAVGNRQGAEYQFLGPWYDLANTHYEQTWKGTPTNPFALGEIILNTAINPTGALLYISIGDQIQAILQWLLDQYAAQGLTAPYKYVGRRLNAGVIDLTTNGQQPTANRQSDKSGNVYVYQLANNPTIDPALYDQFLISYIAKPMMCSQALAKMLELSPRTNIAFDYSTTPPTIYVKSIDNFAAVSLPILDPAQNKEFNIKRRDDLKMRAVKISYRITNTVNGSQQISYAQDIWGANGAGNPGGPSTGLRVLSETLDLQGSSQSVTVAEIDCEPLALIGGSNASKRKWWSSRRGGEHAKFIDSHIRFQDFTQTQTAIPDATLTYATTGGVDANNNPRIAGNPLSAVDLGLFGSRIVQGTYHDWMAASGVYSLKVRAAAKMTFAEYDAVAIINGVADTAGQLPANETGSNTAANGFRHGLANIHEIDVELQLTNAVNPVGGKFTASTISSSTPGELYILGAGGISQYLWNALQISQYEGDAVKVESDFANNVSMTNAINFTGGRAEWTNMNAQPQKITEDYGTKTTTVTIGPANHLNAGQLSSLLNMWAFRRAWYNPALRSDNTQAGNSQVQMPNNAGGSNGTTGLDNKAALALLNYTQQPGAGATGTIAAGIVLDPVKLNYITAMNAQ